MTCLNKYTVSPDIIANGFRNGQSQAGKRFMNAMLNEDGEDDTPEIVMYDDIGEGWYGEGVTGKLVSGMLRDMGPVPKIRVKLNTYGGDVFDGLVIYDALSRHPAFVEMEVTGIAASAGSYIFQAGDKRKIVEGGMVMIHDALTMTYGDAADHLAQAEILEKLSNSIAQLYAARSGRKAETFRKMMTENGTGGTWFTADEAVENKLADEVIKNKKAAARVDDILKGNFSAETRARLVAINEQFNLESQRSEQERINAEAEREKIRQRNSERIRNLGLALVSDPRLEAAR